MRAIVLGAAPAAVFLALTAPLCGQRPHQWIAPSRAVLAPPGQVPVQLAAARARIRILDRTATTELEFELRNDTPSQQEAVLLLPVPDGAAVSAFAFEGQAAGPTAQVLDRDEARRLYRQITQQLRDPALLEFADWRCLRSSVFPVPAHGRQRLRLTYEHVLDGDGARTDYLLPRSEALTLDVPWSIEVELQSSEPLNACYSPSHQLVPLRQQPRRARFAVAERSRREPGPFRFSFQTTADPGQPTASLFACPDPQGGGFFLLLAGAPRPQGGEPLRREITLVLDRSGSMAGRKLEQAKAAALQVLEALDDGEGIQLIEYGNNASSAFAAPVAKSKATLQAARQWLDGLRAHGGTNLHDALQAALQPDVTPGALPLVLFLTDGLPTVGKTREAELRQLVEQGNVHGRRVFCFGVGNDVNVPLLDRIALGTRATTTYVLPDEDVELAVAKVFSRLDQPVLGEPRLRTLDQGRIDDVLPAQLPDLFAGDQLVVLGRYRGAEDLQFELSGRTAAGDRRYAFTLSLARASTAHAFVPRLWASRQIAFLVDQLRQQGGDLGQLATADPFAAPALRELRDEILRLSTRFGVLGEYTAFLAREGQDLGDWRALTMACQDNLAGRAIAVRTGAGAVSQGCNLWAQNQQVTGNYRNAWLDEAQRTVETAAVQQICDRAFFRRGQRWIDSRSVLDQRLQPDEQVEVGSERFFELLRQLEGQHRAGVLSLRGEILLEVGGRNVLVTPAASTNPVVEDHR